MERGEVGGQGTVCWGRKGLLVVVSGWCDLLY